MYKIMYLLCVVVLIDVANSNRARRLQEAKETHQKKDLTEAEVDKLSGIQGLPHLKEVLNEILIPRVVGTANHTKVGDYIAEHMSDLGWDVEQDVFSASTPVFGKLKFRNIVARLDPHADRYLVLACHYDTKYMPEFVFFGATDSAVPCAMLLNLAYTLKNNLNAIKSNTDVSLALVFFDGEEAFLEWGPKDSIYGARHLARKWQRIAYPEGEETNHLHRIDILVLLDLLGASDPTFYSFFPSTQRWYSRLAAAEQRLASSGHLVNYSVGKPEQTYFRHSSSWGDVEDDHIPFLKRNVNILHLIPSPFPDVWHRAEDDYSALDFSTIENLNKIIRVFVAEYLHLVL